MVQSEGEYCAGCGYDLSGLHYKGTCPECGQAFNKVEGEGLSRHGQADRVPASDKHRRGDRVAARMRTIILAMCVVMVLFCGGFVSLAVGSWQSPMAVAGLVAVVLVLATVSSFLSEKEV